jgi:hypothetical protein
MQTPSVVHRFTQPRLYDVACLDPTSLEGEACDPGPHHNSTRSRPGQWLPGSSVHVALPPLLVCSAASLGADKVRRAHVVHAGFKRTFLPSYFFSRSLSLSLFRVFLNVHHLHSLYSPFSLHCCFSS